MGSLRKGTGDPTVRRGGGSTSSTDNKSKPKGRSALAPRTSKRPEGRPLYFIGTPSDGPNKGSPSVKSGNRGKQKPKYFSKSEGKPKATPKKPSNGKKAPKKSLKKSPKKSTNNGKGPMRFSKAATTTKKK